jgi:hypothetical protein
MRVVLSTNEEAHVGTKDKGGAKASKKVAQRSLKEKRKARKQKDGPAPGLSVGR